MSDDLLQPHYADSFRCTGAQCEDTCCQRWGVYLDKATYKKYRATPSLRWAAAEHIELNHEAPDNFKYARIKLKADSRCPFLTTENLCSIQKEHGAEFLSKTCARYPRALVRFEGRMQKALYLSCPEAARLVLLSPQLLPSQEAPRYQEFTLQPSHSSVTLDTAALTRRMRGFALDLLQDRTYPLWQRLFVLGIVCRRVHELTEAQKTSAIPELLGQYATMIQEGDLRSHLDAIPARPGLQLDLVLQLIQRRFQIEQPHEAFASCVGDLLYAIGYSPETPMTEPAARYHEAYLRCYEVFAQAFPSFMENYVLNYLFRTRFPFADIPDEVQVSIDPLTSYVLLAIHYRFLHSLLIGAAARYGSALSAAHAVRVVHAFARAVEHNARFFDVLMEFARSPDLQQSDGLAVLLRN
jgi:lysine-N-methylase